jgi:spore maturation protein SpmA
MCKNVLVCCVCGIHALFALRFILRRFLFERAGLADRLARVGAPIIGIVFKHCFSTDFSLSVGV